jgi:ribosomal protein L37AE/L43A
MANDKAISKLRNIDAVKKMLDGTHRTQTRNSISFSDVKLTDTKSHSVGEVWTDENGVEWEQRSGFKIKKGKLDEIRNMLIENRMPEVCPKCKSAMKKRLDAKFWKLEKHCFDCQIEFEHALRLEGKFEAYQRDRIRRNAESWLSDAEKEAKEIIETFKNPVTFANSDGTFETWSGGRSHTEVAEQIEKEFSNFKENFIEKLK